MSETVNAQAEVVTFKLPAAEKADLERLALSQERTVSAVLRLLVRELIRTEAQRTQTPEANPSPSPPALP
jgi:hypothetical protein